jgi:hypothetical protein
MSDYLVIFYEALSQSYHQVAVNIHITTTTTIIINGHPAVLWHLKNAKAKHHVGAPTPIVVVLAEGTHQLYHMQTPANHLVLRIQGLRTDAKLGYRKSLL